VRTSPETGTTTAQVTLSADVDGLDAGPDALWVTIGGSSGDTAQLLKLDPTTLSLTLQGHGPRSARRWWSPAQRSGPLDLT
jgi:hypothetical protein